MYQVCPHCVSFLESVRPSGLSSPHHGGMAGIPGLPHTAKCLLIAPSSWARPSNPDPQHGIPWVFPISASHLVARVRNLGSILAVSLPQPPRSTLSLDPVTITSYGALNLTYCSEAPCHLCSSQRPLLPTAVATSPSP